MMERTIPLFMFVLLCVSALLTGCARQEPAQSATANASASSPSPGPVETAEVEGELPASEAPEQASPAPAPPQSAGNAEAPSEEENSEMQMNVNVNGQNFTATLENNSAVDALVQMMENGPVTLPLSDYAGFEKVGPLGQSLPTSNSQTTTHAGDIVLYQGNQIVMFYGSNSWSYTRLGHIDDLTGWEEALGSGDVTVTLSMED